VHGERVQFAEGAAVEQQVEPFAGGQPALLVLSLDPFLAAAHPALRAQFAQLLDVRVGFVGHRFLRIF
jgi:hypothetical protein